MEEEQFQSLVKDIIPIAESMKAVLEKHGVDSMVSLTLKKSDEYVDFHHDSGWDFYELEKKQYIKNYKSKERINMEG